MDRYLLTLVFFLATVFGLSAQTPIAEYSFTGNAKDGSSFENHASVNGANLTADRFGWANNAFHFDGEQSALTAPAGVHLNSPANTVSFWVNVDELPGQGEYYLISNGGWQERFKVSLPAHGKLIFTTNYSGGISDMDAGDGNELVPGEWKHVAMVHDGSKDLIYFDGVLVAEKDVVGDLNSTEAVLGIGHNSVDGGNNFAGKLDEVMLFDMALSPADILQLYTDQSTEPVVPQGLVASYDFNNFGNDVSGYDNHASVVSAAITTDRFGFGNSALLLDGMTSEVTAPNGNHMNSDNATIGFWVNVNSLPGSGEVYLLSFGGWQERWKISLPAHGKPVFTTNAVSCCSDLDSGDGNELGLNQWTYVTMVHDGTDDKIFINGVLVNQKESAGALSSTVHPLGIGFNPIDGGSYFDGALDDIEIYNYALTDQEIADRYAAQSQFPGTPPDLVAQYNLDGNGMDATIFSNHATLLEGATPTASRHGFGSNALMGAAVADNSAALQSDLVTISFWANPNSLPGSGEVYLLSHGGWQERWKISLPAHGKPVFTTHAVTCCSDLDSGDGNELVVGQWKHVVMVHDGMSDKIYLDGALVNEKESVGALNKTKHPIGIGYDPIGGENFFDGAIDDVLIYTTAMDATEVADLYNAQKATPDFMTDLVANYTFDEGSNDQTEFRNHAYGMGYVPGKDRFGQANKAARFDGESAFLAAANSPQLLSDFTSISFWVQVSSLPGSGEVYLLSNGGWQERWKISLPAHGKPVFTTHTTSCCNDMDSGDGNELVVGEWRHVVMTHDGVMDKMYMNGVKVNEKEYAGALNTTTHPLGIGYDPVDNQGFFDGSLDEVQVYIRALTDQEIMDLYILQSTAPMLVDTEAPCAPLNLAAVVEFTTVHLSWLLAEDNVGVTGYNVYQDGNLIGVVNGLAISIPDLTPLTAYEFGVSALDAAGNESLVTTLMVTSGEDPSPDTTPPTIPGNLSGVVGSNSVLISWDASMDDRQVIGYVVLVDGFFFDSLAADVLSVLVGGLDPETAYTFEVYAYDKAGNNSEIAEVTLTTTQPLETAEPGLVAHYPFEGNANDATPYENHGAIGGDPVFETSTHPLGAGGQNIKFDGDGDTILVPNAVHLISDFTSVSFWIRVDAVTTDPEAYVLDFGNWNQRWKISLPQHLKIVWTTNGNNAQFDNFVSDMDSGDGNEMVVGFWWFVTMVHDGENDIIYVNGEQANTKPVNTLLNATARDLGMAGNIENGKSYFTGALDDVKVYNRALTADEILTAFQTGTVTSVHDLNLADYGDILLTPNPATNLITVDHSFEAGSDLSVRVFDNLGRQWDMIRPAKSDIQSGKFSIDINQYPTGLYFLNFVLDGQNIGSLKFNKN